MNKIIKQRKLPVSIIVISLLVAFYADIRPVNLSIAYSQASDSDAVGLMGILYPAVFILITFFSIVYRNVKWNIGTQVWFLLVYISLFYFLTYFNIGQPRTSVPFLLGFVFSAMIIPSITNIDVKIFLRALMLYPFWAIFRLNSVFAPVRDWTDAISMDVSYAFLVPVIATIVYMYFYFKSDSKLFKIYSAIMCFVNGAFFIQLFLHGSRGPLLSILLTVFFLLIIKKKENAPGVVVASKKSKHLIISLFLLSCVFVLFFQTIMDALSASHAIMKSIDLNASGDISNGRTYLNELTFAGIYEHPLLGNGFDRFDANTRGGLYPHNFVLQLLYDGGLLYMLVILTPVIRGLVRFFKHCNYDELALMVCLLFSSVPGALFSNNLYENSLLWLFFGYALSRSFVYTTKVYLRNE